MSRERTITVRINGADYTAAVPARKLLSDFIREDAGLTGTHVGCEHGVCGACTVLVEGRGARSCLLFAVQANGREVRTVEDLGTPEAMSGLQESFKTHHGLQCGFCTPGFLMTLTEFLKDNPRPTREEIRAAISGNLCRCTGYAGIIDAVSAVVEASSETES
ncbi:MAG: (2Fe-2S)-binding protein, partial [Nitrospinota bacterium]|nr:(2Fe-2S)-binding protein [Nitrospinota bacterium]